MKNKFLKVALIVSISSGFAQASDYDETGAIYDFHNFTKVFYDQFRYGCNGRQVGGLRFANLQTFIDKIDAYKMTNKHAQEIIKIENYEMLKKTLKECVFAVNYDEIHLTGITNEESDYFTKRALDYFQVQLGFPEIKSNEPIPPGFSVVVGQSAIRDQDIKNASFNFYRIDNFELDDDNNRSVSCGLAIENKIPYESIVLAMQSVDCNIDTSF